MTVPSAAGSGTLDQSPRRAGRRSPTRSLRTPAPIVASAVLLAIMGPAFAQDEPPGGGPRPSVSAEADGWVASPSGWIFITRGSQPGTATRAHDGREFGLDSEVLPAAEAWVRFWESHALGFRIVPAEESGTHTASEDFIYHGQAYAAGREIHSDVGFLLADIDYQYRWEVSADVTLTPHAGAEYWGFSSHLRTVDALPPVDEKRSFSSAYWLAGADLEAGLTPWLRAQALLLGGITGSTRYFVEANAGLAFRPASWASVSLLYRFHEVRFHTSTNEADLLFHGPSAGLELRF